MIYKATDSVLNYMLLQPETGMGYQLIEAEHKFKYKRERFIVYNAEVLLNYDESFARYKKQLFLEGINKSLDNASYISLEKIKIVERNEVKELRTLDERKKKNKGRYSGGKGATEYPKGKADGKEIFVRLSAYENDRRIDFENKTLKPGTFTTTNRDYLDCLRYSDDPIDRYALPNDEEVKWAFYVQPKDYDALQRGIVQPAFGHDGGGIEIYFEDGTSKDTYLYKRPYGK